MQVGEAGVAVSLLALLSAVTAATGVHYTVLQGLVRLLDLFDHAFFRIYLATVFCLLAHAIEICCFALGYFLLNLVGGAGSIGASSQPGWLDCFYFSAQTFSTAGYGDIVAHGPQRILAAGESLSGLLLLGWSITFSMRVRQGVELLRS